MSDRQRHRAFAFSVLFTVAVCVVVWLVERPRPDGGAGADPTAHARRPVVVGTEAQAGSPPPAAGEAKATPPPRGTHAHAPHTPAEASAETAQILRTARRFTGAFAQYEVDRLPADVRRTIRSTATPSFAATLLSAPPSVPQGVRRPAVARVRSVALADRPRGGRAAVAVELAVGSGEVSALTELLSRSGREWRVSGLD
jgi:hypothetical protein